MLRILIGIAGGCCLAGAVALVLRHPAGRTLTILGGTLALALPVLLVPMVVVLPAEPALGLRHSGGLLVHLALPALGLVTVIQSLRRETRAAVTRRAG
ncbi:MULTISPECIES: hypothetical protein [Saccharothrix]|uniref:hypothetical protein n=1 Tax=Saccharothrix TaxID=2071 RepID=UPI0011614B10|nr:hypothetical protein [Saccharothrix sp. CB00851]